MALQTFNYTSLITGTFGGLTSGESKRVDWLSDTIKVMLLTDSYVPDQVNHVSRNDINDSYECAGTNYVVGGATLTTKTLTVDTTSKFIVFDADNVEWSSSTIPNIRYAVVYDDSPVTKTDKVLLCCIDFGETKYSNAESFIIQWGGVGVTFVSYESPA